MTLSNILCVYWIVSIKLVYGQCGSAGNRRLGIHTNGVVTWARSNSKIMANVYADRRWKGWKQLYYSNCNEFENGNTDYFTAFSGVSSKWDAVALYNCGNDGLLIETVYYWNGVSTRPIYAWRPGVFGPFPDKCLRNDASPADDESPPNFWYSDIFIDGNTEGCDGVVFGTGSGTGGSVWTDELPGRPDCDQLTIIGFGDDNPAPVKHNIPIDNSVLFAKQLMNCLMIVIGIVLLLVVSNSCLITMIVKGQKTNKEYGHNKSDMDDL